MHTANPSSTSTTSNLHNTSTPTSTGTRQSVRRASVLRTRGGVALLVAAPSLLLLGSAIHPEERNDPAAQLNVVAGASGRWLLAHLMLVFGATLIGPAIVVAARRLRANAPGWEIAAACLGTVGAGGLVALFSLEGLTAWRLAPLSDRAAAGAAFDQLTAAGEAAGAVGLGVALGGAVLGIALIRVAAAPRLVGLGLAVASALLAVGLVSGIGALAALGMAGTTVAYIAMAVGDMRTDGSGAAS